MIPTQLKLGYIVEETNQLGSSRSKLFTNCAWHAMAEWLVKTSRPIGFRPGTKLSDGDLTLEVKGESLVVDAAFLSLIGVFRCYGEEVRSIRISTEVSMSDSDAYYTAGTSQAYLQEDYRGAIMKMRDKLIRYSFDQLDAGYILTQFAANDHRHPFWTPRLFNRVRGFSM